MRRTAITSIRDSVTRPHRRAPAEIPKELRPVYRAICDHLAETGRFHETDERLVRLYLLALHEAEQARTQVAADGMLVAGSGGQMKSHPLISVANQARLTAAKLATVLGLGPYARQRMAGAVEAVAKAEQPKDPWSDAAKVPAKRDSRTGPRLDA